MFTIYAQNLRPYSSPNKDSISVVNIDYDDAIAVTFATTLRAVIFRKYFTYRSYKDSEFLRLWLNFGQQKDFCQNVHKICRKYALDFTIMA